MSWRKNNEAERESGIGRTAILKMRPVDLLNHFGDIIDFTETGDWKISAEMRFELVSKNWSRSTMTLYDWRTGEGIDWWLSEKERSIHLSGKKHLVDNFVKWLRGFGVEVQIGNKHEN